MNFCMYADHILEIVRYTGARKIPCPLPYVVGILELRRHIVTVVDFHKRVGLPPFALSQDSVMIVTILSSGTFGILVDNISDFRRIPEEQILPPISIAGLPEHLLRGVLTDADDILPIPDFDKIFSSYIHIHLVPINSSDRIAFQYRFTPGSLTQTLEHNLLAQQTLDYAMVKKLSRSLYVPSTKVHRMTSYYADFHPHRHREEEQASWQFRPSRAGDEKYALLARQFGEQHREIGKSRSGPVSPKPDQVADIFSESDISPSAAIALEQVLHRLSAQPGATSAFRADAPKHLRSSVGRPLAQKLQCAPVHITKYFAYYRPVTAHNGGSLTSQSPKALSPDGRSRTAQIRNSSETPVHALLKTLDILHQEQRILTPEAIAKLCAEYQVSSLKLARILSFFPEYRVPVNLNSPATPEDVAKGAHKRAHLEEDSSIEQPAPPAIDPTQPFVNDYLWQLADQHRLFDEQAIRYVASQRGMPTCRLSKLQRYYWWKKHEQTD